MYKITDPAGFDVLEPDKYDEDSEYFSQHNFSAAEEYLQEKGYVVLRNSLDTQQCEQARRSFAAGVKPYAGFLSRQTGSNAQKNVINKQGFLMNPVLNFQDIPEKIIPRFRADALKVVCSEVIRRFLEFHYGERPSIVQTM